MLTAGFIPAEGTYPAGTTARYHRGRKAWWIYLPAAAAPPSTVPPVQMPSLPSTTAPPIRLPQVTAPVPAPMVSTLPRATTTVTPTTTAPRPSPTPSPSITPTTTPRPSPSITPGAATPTPSPTTAATPPIVPSIVSTLPRMPTTVVPTITTTATPPPAPTVAPLTLTAPTIPSTTSKTSTSRGFFGFGQDAAPAPDAEVPGTEDSPPPGVTVQAPIEEAVARTECPVGTVIKVAADGTVTCVPAAAEKPIYKKWWFWAAVGGGVAIVGGGAWYFTRKGKSKPVQGLRDWEEDFRMRGHRYSMVVDGIRFDTAAVDPRFYRDPRWRQRWEFDLKQEIKKFKASKPTKLYKVSETHYTLPGTV